MKIAVVTLHKMEIIGYVAALIVGVSMGLIGGGGSILTLPILVYLFGIEPLIATSYSLFVVGITSFAGVILKIKEKQVDFKMALLFGLPDLLGVVVMRTFIFPPIPGNLFLVHNHMVTKGELVLILVSILMLISSFLLLKRSSKLNPSIHENKQRPVFILMLIGFLTGLLTGMVGVGGGFIIIPVLVLWTQLPMKFAIGTSLAIIAAKSIMGFVADKVNFNLEHNLILWISGLSLIGLFLGNTISRQISALKLQKGFGWLVILVGAYMFFNTLYTILIKN